MKKIKLKSTDKKDENKLPERELLFISPVLAAAACSAFDARLKIQNYELKSVKIKKPVKLALLTDLHSCRYGKNQKTLINAVKNEDPDCVLFGGDIVDDKLDESRGFLTVGQIAKAFPSYYVMGNHEYKRGRSAEIQTRISSLGAVVLEGSRDILDVGGQKITICGVSDPTCTKKDPAAAPFYDQLYRVSLGISEDPNYTILLVHRPERVDEYLRGFDLILTGHAHGGQWRIPGILNGLYAPNQGFFPKFAGGMYDFYNSKMIVSRGLSRENNLVPRIWNRPELVIINLKPLN